MKDCNTCGETKPLKEFYAHRAKCRDCYGSVCSSYFTRNQERIQKAHTTYMREYRHGNELARRKEAARMAVYWAVEAGRITKEPCHCGSSEVQAHHYNGYEGQNKLRVRWLCRPHHMELHRV